MYNSIVLKEYFNKVEHFILSKILIFLQFILFILNRLLAFLKDP